MSRQAGEYQDLSQVRYSPKPQWLEAYFAYKHLPPKLQVVGACFYNFAKWMVDALPDNADRTDALIKLHAAKDAAMWAAASEVGTGS